MSIVKILPPPEGGPGQGTRVLDADGNPIPNVISVDVHYRIDEVITADITLFARPDPVNAEARFVREDVASLAALVVDRVLSVYREEYIKKCVAKEPESLLGLVKRLQAALEREAQP